MLKLCTQIASATFLLALMLASEANAERRLPPCPKDRSVSWDNCQGTHTWLNGGKYVGEFKDGKGNGQGTLTSPDGEKYVGEWKDGERNGQGTLTWPDGRKYVGEFKDRKKNGPGTLYSSDGSVRQSGIWKEDTLVAPAADNLSNKATTLALGLPEKTDGYLGLVLLAIAAIAAIAAIFLMKDRTEPSIRVSSPAAATKFPATELEGAQRPQQPEQVPQPSPTSVSRGSERVQALERLSQLREKGTLTDAECEQEKKRILA